MKLSESKIKYYTKYKVNATNFFFYARAQNKVISAFLVLKLHLSNTAETYKLHMKVNGHESQYHTKFQVDAANI